MQLTLRIDNDNYVTVEFSLSPANASQFTAGPELTAATIVDSKLSIMQDDELFDLTGQIVDYFSRSQADNEPVRDWRQEWLAATAVEPNK